MRELEASLQQFGEFILKARLVKEQAAPSLIEQQGVPHPRVESQGVRDFATYLAVHRRVSASTQNQAISAVLFLWREILGLEVDNLGLAARAKRGIHLPVVLSMPETAALLGAMAGTPGRWPR